MFQKSARLSSHTVPVLSNLSSQRPYLALEGVLGVGVQCSVGRSYATIIKYMPPYDLRPYNSLLVREYALQLKLQWDGVSLSSVQNVLVAAGFTQAERLVYSHVRASQGIRILHYTGSTSTRTMGWHTLSP